MSGSRAAVFTQQSQSVEVLVEGAWWPGSILGWRHDGAGACEVWVCVTVAGVDRESWTDLADLRLPESRPAPAPIPAAAANPFPGAAELLPGASATPPLSLGEAAVREQLAAGVLPASASGARPRRRHGGDVTAEMPAVHGGPAGRHRAGGIAGRHRATDDGPRPEESPAAERADATVLMPRAAEVDCLTRPLRLGDRVSRPRLPRPGAALRA